MEKVKLINRRKESNIFQAIIAEKLCMDVSNYNRREKGKVKISLQEWKKLANIPDVPAEEIYEPEENPISLKISRL